MIFCEIDTQSRILTGVDPLLQAGVDPLLQAPSSPGGT